MDIKTEGENAAPKNCYRLVIVGTARAGKTSIVSRFLNDKFEEKYTPTIENFHRKVYRIRGEAYRLDILDTSGNDPFPAMRRLSLLSGDIFIIVFSVDNMESFEEAKRLRDQIQEVKSFCPPGSKKFRHIPMVLVGNKLDRADHHRAVNSMEVNRYIESQSGCAYVEASAKKDWNIEDIFLKLFIMADLPTEMSPSLHRKVHPSYVGKTTAKSTTRCGPISLRRRLSDACGTVTSVRRPSIRTDLLILQTKSRVPPEVTNTSDAEATGVKCVIQ
ncbi:GTP-binding protein Rhes [Lingula anatina]|nr:GTP-binding protein Rhes [Lingula anatina]|eukprot:XP_013417251.1 GTP-binding protein Rhes [Lingula anatina]